MDFLSQSFSIICSQFQSFHWGIFYASPSQAISNTRHSTNLNLSLLWFQRSKLSSLSLIFKRFNSPCSLLSIQIGYSYYIKSKIPITGSMQYRIINDDRWTTINVLFYYYYYYVCEWGVIARYKRGSFELERISWANKRVNGFLFYMCVSVCLLVCS